MKTNKTTRALKKSLHFIFFTLIAITIIYLPDNYAQAGQSPINVLNGNVYEQQTDISFKTPFTKGLSFKRSYNSQSNDDSAIGYGWTHNYNLVLTPNFGGSSHMIKISGLAGKGYFFEDHGSSGQFNGILHERSMIKKVPDADYNWTSKDGTTYRFEEDSGRLLSITDPSGNVQTMTYNNDLLETITDEASGRFLKLHYNAENKIAFVEGPVTPSVPDGIWVSFSYDVNNNLTGVVYADDENGSLASGFEYQYDDTDPNNLTSIRDLSGTVISSYGYTADDKANAYSNKGEAVALTIDYTNPDAVELTDAYGVTTIYTITDVGGRRKITQRSRANGCNTCADGIYITQYTDEGYRSSNEYFNGRVDSFLNHDSKGNPGTIIKAQGSSEERTLYKTYHKILSTPLTITEKSLFADEYNPDRIKKTTYDYDNPDNPNDTAIPNEAPTNLIHKVIESGYTLDEDGRVVEYKLGTTYTYTSKGQLETIVDPLGNEVLVIGYDPDTGDIKRMTNALQQTITYGTDGTGAINRYTDLNNHVTSITRDGRGRVLTNTFNNKTQTTRYTRSGNLLNTIDRTKRKTAYTYDPDGLLKKIISPNKDYRLFDYDETGNKIEESIYSSLAVKTFYSGFDFGDPSSTPSLTPGKPWKKLTRDQADTQTLETVYAYEHGNVSNIKTPDGQKTEYTYDAFNRLKTSNRGLGPSLITTQYAYDTHGNLIQVIDAENKPTTYLYDDLDHLVKTISPDTGTTQFTYNELSQLTRKNHNNLITTYTHDRQNRLTHINYPADTSRNIEFKYDERRNGKGRLSGRIDPSGTYAFYYNKHGSMIKEVKTISGVSYTTNFAYDNEQRLRKMGYPSKRQVYYIHDNTGRTKKISTRKDGVSNTIARRIKYEPFGPLKSLIFGNKKKLAIEFDLNYLPENITILPDINLTQVRDTMNQITGITDNVTAKKNQSFEYDYLYHLENASGPYGDLSFSYDMVGNSQIKEKDGIGDNYDYIPETNHIDHISGSITQNFTHDTNGNIKTVGDREYFYDLDGHLLRVEDSGTETASYTYSANHQRMSKTVNDITTVYHYDISGNLIAETAQNGSLLKEYLYLDNTPVAMIVHDPAENTDKIYYYHNNHLNTPVKMTDSQGEIAWQADYTPFGSLDIVVNKIENNLRFPGQYFDSETGLHYNWHRYYDPSTGRYLTPDPIGLAGGINLYAYVQNDPVNLIDPLGLTPSFYECWYDCMVNSNPPWLIPVFGVVGTLAAATGGTAVVVISAGGAIYELSISGACVILCIDDRCSGAYLVGKSCCKENE